MSNKYRLASLENKREKVVQDVSQKYLDSFIVGRYKTIDYVVYVLPKPIRGFNTIYLVYSDGSYTAFPYGFTLLNDGFGDVIFSTKDFEALVGFCLLSNIPVPDRDKTFGAIANLGEPNAEVS